MFWYLTSTFIFFNSPVKVPTTSNGALRPMAKVNIKSRGSMFLNEFHAFIKAFFVFCLLFLNEIIKNIIATIYIAPLKI